MRCIVLLLGALTLLGSEGYGVNHSRSNRAKLIRS